MGTVVRGPLRRCARRSSPCAPASSLRRSRPVARRMGDPRVVVSVAMLGAGSDPAGYYLARQANCPADYYLGADPTGRWLGSGAAAAGLTGSPGRRRGRHLAWAAEGGDPGRRGSWWRRCCGADPRGRLPAGPLVDAVQASAHRQGVPVEELFTDPADRARCAALATRAARPGKRGRVATVDPARAGKLAKAAGLDPHAVYGTRTTTPKP